MIRGSRFSRGGVQRFFKDGDGAGGDGGGGGGSGAPPDWRETLPADLKEDPSLKDFKDVSGLAKSYREMVAYRGRSILPPGPEASPEQVAEFEKKLQERVPGLVRLPKEPEKQAAWLKEIGLTPKEAKEYVAKKLDGVEFSDEEMGALRATAERRGYTKDMFQKLVEDAANEKTAYSQKLAEGRSVLQKEWGTQYDEKLARIRGVIEQTNAPARVREAVAKGQLDPDTARWLVSLAGSVGAQPREVASQDGGGTPKMTPAEAEEEISQLMGDKEYYLTTPRARRMQQRVAALEAFASPELARQAAMGGD